MKQQVVIDVVPCIKRSQRQPRKGRRKVMIAQRLPQYVTPLNMIVTVKISAADRISRELQLPEHQTDGNGAGAELNYAQGGLRLKKNRKMEWSFHLPANCVSDKQGFISQLFDKIEESAGIDRLGYVLIKSRG